MRQKKHTQREQVPKVVLTRNDTVSDIYHYSIPYFYTPGLNTPAAKRRAKKLKKGFLRARVPLLYIDLGNDQR